MYLPNINRPTLTSRVILGGTIAAEHDGLTTYHAVEKLGSGWPYHPIIRTLRTLTDAIGPGLRKRAPIDDMNTKIGVIVGVVLGVFLVAIIGFLYLYGTSIRFTPRRKKRRHRHSGGSKSSKSSKSSDGGGGAAADAPPAS